MEARRYTLTFLARHASHAAGDRSLPEMELEILLDWPCPLIFSDVLAEFHGAI